MDSLSKNQLIEAEIVGYGADGAGIARHGGQVVFVPGAARGDVCRLRVTKALKNRAYARIDSLLSPSPHRVENDCPAFPKCGGCDFRHISYEEELWLKARRVRDAMARLGGADPGPVDIFPAPAREGYRNKAQFPVAAGPEGAVYGFYRRRSHDIIPLTACLIQDSRACALADAVCRWADETGTPPYDEAAHSGQLRHIYVRTAGQGGDGSHLCLVLRSGAPRQPQRLIDLCRQAEPGLRGIAVSLNPDRTNRVLGDRLKVLWGNPLLEETLLGHTFGLSPQSFFQVNKPVTEALYNLILAWAGDRNQLALDLYCGIGTITLALARRFDRVVGVEIVPQAVANAQASARANGVDNVDFLLADAGQAAARLAAEGHRPDLIVCDPPRKGMDAAGLEAIAAMAPARVLYVACDPASLARDTATLAATGYQLEALRAFDMFPRTANVETVVLLSRKTPNDVIHVDLELDELDITAAEAKATYQEIKDYVLDKFGFKVSLLYIAQVKRKHGIIERENYNTGEGKAKVPQVPADKEAAIEDALRYFEMI